MGLCIISQHTQDDSYWYTIQKWNVINCNYSKDAFIWWRNSKDIYKVTKDFDFKINVVLLNILFIQKISFQRILKNYITEKHFHKIFASTTVFNIDNKKLFLSINQHLRIISEGSCDTEDWSNNCWKFSFAITGINFFKKILLFYYYKWLLNRTFKNIIINYFKS